MKLSDAVYSHDNNFNLIRFLAAYAVLLSHSFVLVTGNDIDQPLMQRLGYTFGAISVDIFFVTSGFLITGSLLRRRGFISYFKARALRIYPALWLVVVLTVFVLAPLLTNMPLHDYFSNHKTWRYLYENCTVILFGVYHSLPGMFESNPYKNEVNGSLWTLTFEMTSYIAVALFWFLCSKLFKTNKKAMALFVTVLTLTLLTLFYLSKLGLQPSRDGFRLYFFFFCGAAMFLLAEHIKLKHSLALAAALLVGIGVIFPTYFHFIYAPLLGYITLYCAYVPAGALRKFNQAGDYSYGIYIYAFPAQQSLVFLKPDISILQMILSASVITLSCAMLSWHFIEKKALTYK
jgi:peptidoglycan/LPS O-acetylase OafA/YrhL